MCTNQREIKNKYTGQTLYKKCGHCPACLQEKAAYRVSRIKAQDSKDLDCVLVGLTYRRHCAPYVLRDDAFRFSRGELKSLPVYRDTHFRKVRQNASYDIDYNQVHETRKLCDIDFVEPCDFHGLRDLKFETGKIGVIFYPDVQRFLARLRLNLHRNFSFNHEIKTFCCSEYGIGKVRGKGIFRPHFHLLFWIPKGNYETFRSAVFASWPYGDISRFPRSCELAYQAATYVASYVNSGSDFPQFLEKYFKPKHSYSKDFGCNKELFSLPKILEKFGRGHLTYYSLQADKVGNPVMEFPFPKYVIHRYFPKFKGYSRFTIASLLDIMSRFGKLEEEPSFRSLNHWLFESPFISDLDFINRIAEQDRCLYYSPDDAHKIHVRLNNAYSRFIKNAPLEFSNYSFGDYCELHHRVWSLYISDILRLHLQNDEIPLYEKYYNLKSFVDAFDYDGSPLPLGFTRQMIKETDPNKFLSVVRNTVRFETSFYDHIKHRRVAGSIYSASCEEF